MRYFIFSDIHGNLEALTVVLNQIPQFHPDRVVCLGDVVGYGPNPNECVQRINQIANIQIMGNHDHAVLGLTDVAYFNQFAKMAVLWTRQILSKENLEILRTFTFKEPESDILFVHSTPVNPERWDYIFNPLEGKYYLQHLQEHICFIGHSHQPLFFEKDVTGQVMFHRNSAFTFSMREGSKYIVNVGSVGQPRDGNPETSFGVYDSDSRTFEVHRLPYDIAATQKKMTELNLPSFLIDRLAYGK